MEARAIGPGFDVAGVIVERDGVAIGDETSSTEISGLPGARFWCRPMQAKHGVDSTASLIAEGVQSAAIRPEFLSNVEAMLSWRCLCPCLQALVEPRDQGCICGVPA